LIEHCLKVNLKATPKKQRLQHFAPNKRETIKKELAKLLTAGFIKEVCHLEWLANPVLVLKKNNNEWRMCVNYTDLNKHCQRIPSRSHASTRSPTLQLAVSYSPSSTATRVTTRSLSRKKIGSKRRSSPPLEYMHTQPYPSG
jgi:hypothetical protein